MSNTNIKNLLITVRKTYDQSGDGKNVGPTADNTSRIALLKKVQVRTNYYDAVADKTKYSQLWGLNNLSEKGNKSGSNGDSGIRTKFVGIFPRMHF
tara:strand:+ start:103 stop:390 length:288 start_codon:yes stop_codon:yes gene_type:complete